MFWAQLILLACLLLTVTAHVRESGKEGAVPSCVAVAICMLCYFAGAFSEVVAWLK